jgi:hypothetical protein
VNEWGGG